MIIVTHIFLPFLASLLFILIVDSVGRFVGRHTLGNTPKGSVLHIFIGLAVVFPVIAIATVGWRSASIFVLISLLWPYFFRPENENQKTNERSLVYADGKEVLILFVVHVCALLVHYSLKNGQVFTHFIDHYNYSDLITFIDFLHKEATFTHLESEWFGGGFSFQYYHFYEIYLGIFFKLFSDVSNAQVLFFYVYPCMLGIALTAVFRYLKPFVRPSAHWFLLLFIICLGTISRTTLIYNFIPWLSADEPPFNLLKNFPIYFITNTDFHFLFEYFKVSGGLFFLVCVIHIIQEKKPWLYPVIIVLAFFMNPLFVPFLLLFIGFSELKNVQNWKHIIGAVLTLGLVFVFYAFLNLDSTIPNVGLPNNIDLGLFSLKVVAVAFKDMILDFLFSHFTLVFFCSIFILLYKELKMRFSIFFYVLLFPLVFYFIDVLLISYLLGLIGIGFYLFFRIRKPDQSIVVCLLLSALVLFFIDLLLKNIPNFYQFFKINIIVSYYIIPILLFKHVANHLKLNIGVALLSVLFLAHVASIYGFQNRVYYREKSSKPFVNQVLKRPDLLKKAGFISDYQPVPYFYLNRPGGDIQNETDSLLITAVSLLNLSKEDSASFAKNGYWNYYNMLPVVQFQQKRGAGLSNDSVQVAFIKHQQIKLILRHDRVDRKLGNFMNRYITDSLYNETEHYTIYYLRF